MADQAAVNGGPRVRINAPLVEGVLGNVAEFGGDVASLAELQARLAAIDLKQSIGRAVVPAVVLAATLGLALGTVPVALIGVAELLAIGLDIQRGWSLLLVAGAALVLAAGAAAVSLPRLVRSFESFRRSREELARNVAWVKTVLAHSGRVTPTRR